MISNYIIKKINIFSENHSCNCREANGARVAGIIVAINPYLKSADLWLAREALASLAPRVRQCEITIVHRFLYNFFASLHLKFLALT